MEFLRLGLSECGVRTRQTRRRITAATLLTLACSLSTATSANTSLLPDWSSLVNSTGTVNTPANGVVAVIRDTVANSGAVDATRRTSTGNEVGSVGRLYDVGNTYFFADDSGDERIVYTATERRSHTGNPKRVVVILTLKREKKKNNKGDIRAKIKFNSREEPSVFVVKRYSGFSWERVHLSRFNGELCTGDGSLAMACLTDAAGSIVAASAPTLDSSGNSNPVLAPDQMIQMRLNLSKFPATTRCSVLTVKTVKDIARGTVDCKPNAQGNRLQALADISTLEQVLKDGMIAQLDGSSELPRFVGVPDYAPTIGDATAQTGPSPTAFTTTNPQEASVEDHDYVKSDGDVLYILRSGNEDDDPLNNGDVSFINLRVVDIDSENGSATALTEIALNGGNPNADMFLYPQGSKLALVSDQNHTRRSVWSSWFNPYQGRGTVTNIGFVDISNPASPTYQSTIRLDGTRIASRRVGRTLYVATRFLPDINGIDFSVEQGTSAYDQAVAKIESRTKNQLLPHYQHSTDFTATTLLSEPENCFVAKRGQQADNANVLSITAINLDTETIVDSVCFVGPTETIHMSSTSLYLATTRYSYEARRIVTSPTLADGPESTEFVYADAEVTTDIHKFSLGLDSIAYQASGTVAGHLGWNPDRKPWRMSESGEHLRVVTISERFATRGSPVMLSILKDTNGGRLDTVATLPNSSRPENVTEPAKRLHASRFVGERAYFIQKNATDPLTVVDLSNPADPKVTGELEIDGYMDYLRPVDDQLMLGLGKGYLDGGSQGVKLALFDVSDPNNPHEIDSVEIGKRSSQSAPLLTPKAFTIMPASNGNPARVALDMQVHETPDVILENENPALSGHRWTSSGAYLFEIDAGPAPGLRQTGNLSPRNREQPTQFNSPLDPDQNERTIIVDDSIYYISRFDVFGARWNSPSTFNGPH